MSKRYTTIDGLFGTKIHLDENGNYAGESVPGHALFLNKVEY